MDKELEIIEMIIDDEAENGVSALSLVETPATQDETILLSAQEHKIELAEVLNNRELVQLAEVDNEKQLILGLVLEPDTPIYRREGDKEYYITFKPHTVERAAQMYMAQLNNNNVTLNHDKTVDGVSVVESWMVSDPGRDKSAVFGKAYKKGSWAVVMKVHDKAKWEQFKKDGTTNISLEGVFKPKEESTPSTDLIEQLLSYK